MGGAMAGAGANNERTVLSRGGGHLQLHEHLGTLLHALPRQLLAAVQGHGRAAAPRLEQQAHAVGRNVQLELRHNGLGERSGRGAVPHLHLHVGPAPPRKYMELDRGLGRARGGGGRGKGE